MRTVQEIIRYAKRKERQHDPLNDLRMILAEVYELEPYQVTEYHIHLMVLELAFQAIMMSGNPGVRFNEFGLDMNKKQSLIKACLEQIKFLDGSVFEESMLRYCKEPAQFAEVMF